MRRLAHTCALAGWFVLCSAGCGSRTATWEAVEDSMMSEPEQEQCNGEDDDGDGRVDEDFRDEEGRYVHDDHCGGCGRACSVAVANATRAYCTLIEDVPACVAESCREGFGRSVSGRCVPIAARLCLPCADDGGCGSLESARCVSIASELRCTVTCDDGCPAGYGCDDAGLCVPPSGSCSCEEGDDFTLACRPGTTTDATDSACVGRARCENGLLSACEVGEEVCDEQDNDCDGLVDGAFVDEDGVYSVDDAHCGACGVDCAEETAGGLDLTCGGDAFAPSCILHCPDADDGIQVGDRVDGDFDIATGCDCTVTSLDDAPGPVLTSGEQLDTNCDGADGVVRESFYVALDGDDTGLGSPSRPLRTIGEALRRAAESLDTPRPRDHVFVASGTYTEALLVPDGVSLFGGYRRDFRGLDPEGLRTVVRAPSDTPLLDGAALGVDGAGERPTVIQWLTIQGRDAQAPGRAAVAVDLRSPGPSLVLRGLEIQAGVPGEGRNGVPGAAGAASSQEATSGGPPRAAQEDANHLCIAGATNRVAGGRGGRNSCGGVDVRGGDGGSPGCPSFPSNSNSGQVSPPGADGNGTSAQPAGLGGRGGVDVRGPISGHCGDDPVCCGLSDFMVPLNFAYAESGAPGSDGAPGSGGQGCGDPIGRLSSVRWTSAAGGAGLPGTPGSGGGGGGGGGGAQIDWVNGWCAFVDGLGGGGGGGGAGGCGGAGGQGGVSGGPSIGIAIRSGGSVPILEDLRVLTAAGAPGYDGGAGGDGGLGGTGAFGGAVPPESQSIPTLAGPSPGARGGKGGNGGPGGGGGGGCGGSSIGIWLEAGPSGFDATGVWGTANAFELGPAGRAGRGGGGAVGGSDGEEGRRIDVWVP